MAASLSHRFAGFEESKLIVHKDAYEKMNSIQQEIIQSCRNFQKQLKLIRFLLICKAQQK